MNTGASSNSQNVAVVLGPGEFEKIILINQKELVAQDIYVAPSFTCFRVCSHVPFLEGLSLAPKTLASIFPSLLYSS